MTPLLLLSAWGWCPLPFVQINLRQDLSKNKTVAAPSCLEKRKASCACLGPPPVASSLP